jgi:hypothetical protein
VISPPLVQPGSPRIGPCLSGKPPEQTWPGLSEKSWGNRRTMRPAETVIIGPTGPPGAATVPPGSRKRADLWEGRGQWGTGVASLRRPRRTGHLANDCSSSRDERDFGSRDGDACPSLVVGIIPVGWLRIRPMESVTYAKHFLPQSCLNDPQADVTQGDVVMAKRGVLLL